MSRLRLLRETTPYFAALVSAAYFYQIAEQFQFSQVAGRIGPDRWPKLILGLMMAVCIYEIGRRFVVGLFFSEAMDAHTRDATEQQHSGEELSEESYPVRVLSAIAATLVYLYLIEIVGFFIDTFFLMIVIMWLGRFEKPISVLLISLISTLAFMAIFMKAVYVSLPVGIEPFSKVSNLVMQLLGIR